MNAIERLIVNPGPVRMGSPWGDVQHSERIGEGVTFVATASHGGLMLAEDAQKRLPRDVRDCFLNGHGWAEEDCEAPIVLTLLGLMPDERGRLMALHMAATLERYRPCVSHLEEKTGFEAVATITADMRRVAKVIRQSRGVHLRADSTIATALDDLERGGYAVPDAREGGFYGWKLTPAGEELAK